MWNIAISLVAPCYNNPVPLFHNKEVPDVVLIVNGGCWRSMKKAASHFSATAAKDKSFKIPGSVFYNTHREAESLAKVLTPTLLTNKEDARKRAINDYKHQEATRSLKLLRSVAISIDRLNDKIADMIEESEEVIETKKMLEYKLTCLGVSVEKIAEAGELKERGFIRTEEREKIHRERAEKRKRDEKEETEMKQREAKKQKTIATVKGERRKSYEHGTKDDDDDNEEEGEGDDFRDKQAKQQQELLKAQEKIMTWQDTELGEKERRIRELEKRLAAVQKENKAHEVTEIDDDDEYGMRRVKQEP